jgi:excisionase family DNA binding protein
MSPEAAFHQPIRLLSYEDVLKRTTLSRQHVWRMVRAGKFPTPVKIGRRRCWSEGAVTEWIEAQISA